MITLSQFATFFQNGGPFMIVILGVAVVIVAVALERAWVIGRASSWQGRKLAMDLTERVLDHDTSGALDIVAKVRSPAAQVAGAILRSRSMDEETLMNAADGEAAVVLPGLSRRLPHLNLLANAATLLGLLGTIFGLTTAFSAVGAADPSQRSAFLAAGISQALNTTAFGLIVAVPTLLIHGFLVGRVERIVEHVDEVSVRLIRALVETRSAPEARSRIHAVRSSQSASSTRSQ